MKALREIVPRQQLQEDLKLRSGQTASMKPGIKPTAMHVLAARSVGKKGASNFDRSNKSSWSSMHVLAHRTSPQAQKAAKEAKQKAKDSRGPGIISRVKSAIGAAHSSFKQSGSKDPRAGIRDDRIKSGGWGGGYKG